MLALAPGDKLEPTETLPSGELGACCLSCDVVVTQRRTGAPPPPPPPKPPPALVRFTLPLEWERLDCSEWDLRSPPSPPPPRPSPLPSRSLLPLRPRLTPGWRSSDERLPPLPWLPGRRRFSSAPPASSVPVVPPNEARRIASSEIGLSECEITLCRFLKKFRAVGSFSKV